MKARMIVLMLAITLLAGCGVKIEGYGITYARQWGKQQLDDVTIEITDPNGVTIKIWIQGQKSDTELALEAAGFGMKAGSGK